MSIKTRKTVLKWLLVPGFVIVWIALAQLAAAYHTTSFGDWRSEIYADKSGYYIYLPATFICGFHQQSYPDSIDFKLGNGFGFVSGKLFTKYTYGVALLTSPFFLTTHFYLKLNHLPSTGFNELYLPFAYYASTFYMLSGAIFLFLFLKKRAHPALAAASVLAVCFGTNLFYYTFKDALMSHVYSFALFSVSLWLTDNYLQNRKVEVLALLSVSTALILLIRPSNLIFVAFLPFLDAKNLKDISTRFSDFLSLKKSALILSIFFFIFLPQLLYWKFISGSYFYWTYLGEGFTNWNKPLLSAVLLAPRNGLIPYTPLFLLIITGMVHMWIRKMPNRVSITLVFVVVWYMVASWHMFDFGCSYGQRSFVEYTALFSIPLVSVFGKAGKSLIGIIKVGLIAVIAGVFIWFNISMSAAYAGCFESSVWNWSAYRHHMITAGALPFVKNIFVWKNDFEKPNRYSTAGLNIVPYHAASSGRFANHIHGDSRYSDGFEVSLREAAKNHVYSVKVDLKLLPLTRLNDVKIACSVHSGDSVLYFNTLPVTPLLRQKQWNRVQQTFSLPFIANNGSLRIYLMSTHEEDYLIDDFEVKVISD